MIPNLPTLLTLLRIVMLPIIIVMFYLPYGWARPAASLIFVLAALTDWLDGYLARLWNQESRFGAFLDPVADKLMVATTLLREWMAEMGQRGRVAVGWLGKVKTTLQMLALALLLYMQDIGPIPTYQVGMVALYVASALTVWSMLEYLKAAFFPTN